MSGSLLLYSPELSEPCIAFLIVSFDISFSCRPWLQCETFLPLSGGTSSFADFYTRWPTATKLDLLINCRLEVYSFPISGIVSYIHIFGPLTLIPRLVPIVLGIQLVG